MEPAAGHGAGTTAATPPQLHNGEAGKRKSASPERLAPTSKVPPRLATLVLTEAKPSQVMGMDGPRPLTALTPVTGEPGSPEDGRQRPQWTLGGLASRLNSQTEDEDEGEDRLRGSEDSDLDGSLDASPQPPEPVTPLPITAKDMEGTAFLWMHMKPEKRRGNSRGLCCVYWLFVMGILTLISFTIWLSIRLAAKHRMAIEAESKSHF